MLKVSDETTIDGLRVITYPIHGDDRGSFSSPLRNDCLQQVVGDPFAAFQQVNTVKNAQYVLRGLHVDGHGKWVTVTRGKVTGVWLDCRYESPTFGQKYTVIIVPGTAVYVPPDVANGYYVHEDNTDYVYGVTHAYLGNFTGNIDPYSGGIKPSDWGIPYNVRPILKEADENAPRFETLCATVLKTDRWNRFRPEMPRILIVGGGFVGEAVQRYLGDSTVIYPGKLHTYGDIVAMLTHYRPEVVINTAFSGTPASIEQLPADSQELAQACALNGSRFIHISSAMALQPSDQVLDTNAPLFTEKAGRSRYAEQKYRAEGLLIQHFPKSAAIIRIHLPIDSHPHPRNLLDRLCTFANVASEPVSVTLISDLASMIREMTETGCGIGKIHHCVLPSPISMLDIAHALHEAGLRTTMPNPVSHEALGQIPYQITGWQPEAASSIPGIDLIKIMIGSYQSMVE
jgi:dTDP-4-dehydrorhamnose 3,5-epimerase-like enzyme/dTDP-4-dehydrorhamnose reductase